MPLRSAISEASIYSGTVSWRLDWVLFIKRLCATRFID
jgi:hypothetical protein